MVNIKPPVFGPPTKPPVYTLNAHQKLRIRGARNKLSQHLENLQGPVPKGRNLYEYSVATKALQNTLKGGKRRGSATRKSKKSRRTTRRRR